MEVTHGQHLARGPWVWNMSSKRNTQTQTFGSTYHMEDFGVLVWYFPYWSSFVGGEGALLTAEGCWFIKTIQPAFHSLMICVTNMFLIRSGDGNEKVLPQYFAFTSAHPQSGSSGLPRCQHCILFARFFFSSYLFPWILDSLSDMLFFF